MRNPVVFASAFAVCIGFAAAPALSVAAKFKPLPGQQQASENITLEQHAGKIRNLTTFLQQKYQVPAQKARLIVTEAFQNAIRHALDPELVLAVVAVESTFRDRAASPKGAKGLVQMRGQAYPDRTRDSGATFLEVRQNRNGGTQLLAGYLQELGGDLRAALARYNGSQKNPKAPYPGKVLVVYNELKRAAVLGE